MRSATLAFFALASVAHANQKAFTGKGAIEVWTEEGEPAGCLDASGSWVHEGQFGQFCAIYTSSLARTHDGVDGHLPFKLWSDRNSTSGCEIQDSGFFCSSDVSEPDELIRQREYPGTLANAVDGSKIWWAARKPTQGSPSPVYGEPPNDDSIGLFLPWNHWYA